MAENIEADVLTPPSQEGTIYLVALLFVIVLAASVALRLGTGDLLARMTLGGTDAALRRDRIM